MSDREPANRESTIMELAVGCGFFAVALAVVLARRVPATTFERSIYASTPLASLLLFLFALLVALAASLYATGYRRGAGIALGGTAIVGFVSLPLVRGYHFLGGADSLTHLGWTRDIASGMTEPHTLFYPSYHTFSLAIGRLTGIPLEQALLVATVLLFAVFVVHVPLAARALSESPTVVSVAAIAGWFILPINHVATHLLPHTNSLALFFFPVVLFVLVVYLTRGGRSRHLYGLVTPFGVALAIASAAFVVMHLQHAVNLLLLFLTIIAVQYAVRRKPDSSPIANHQPLYAQTGLLTAFVIGWATTHSTTNRAISAVLVSLFESDIGAVTEVTQRGSSLLAVGGSLPGLFAKLFIVTAVFSVVGAVYMVGAHTQLLSVPDLERGMLTYFLVALVPLTVLFGVYFFGTPKMSFRQLGFISVIVTIVGALAFARLDYRLGRSNGPRRLVPAVVLALCLVLSMAVVFPSPYIHQPTPHVTEQGTSGYATAFDTRAGATPYASIDSVASRYGDAIYGRNESADINYTGAGSGFVDPAAFNRGDFGAAYPADTYYLVFTQSDLETQLLVYDELNYRREAVAALGDARRVNRVQSNGGFEVYVVTNATAT